MGSFFTFFTSTNCKILIALVTAVAVYFILQTFGVFEIMTSTKKMSDTVVNEKKEKKKRADEIKKLNFYSSLTNTFKGILMNPTVMDKHQYYINRLEIKSEILDRLYTPEELRGEKFAPFFLSLILVPLSLFWPVVLMVPIVLFINFLGYPTVYNAKIAEEDEIIDDYFLDLYLLLYSKLKQGSRARIQSTVENYIDTLQTSQDVQVRDVMLKLARYLLNLLSLYEDHVAVPKLKEVYHSATIINFCNVASQSLNGVENFDNLLTFKMQLVERKTNVMRKRSMKICMQGARSIYAIYIILFIFIGVGWYSKLPTGIF